MNQENQHRIISWENLEQRIDVGASFVSKIAGTPRAELFFDANRNELGFVVDVDTDSLPTVEPMSIDIRHVRPNGHLRLEIRSSDRILFREFYDFGVEIIDSAQTNNVSPHKAVDAAWGAWVRLLDRKAILSKEKQLGLIGELWLLRRIANNKGWAFALDSWHGEANAEHDFCLATVDIEVKSTTNEQRVHTIGSATQLLKSPDRDLYLLSLQFTPAMRGVANAVSLSGEVESIVNELDDGLRSRLDARLTAAGWRSEHSRHYGQVFVHRSKPVLVKVDEECPRLTLPMIAQLGQMIAHRVGSISYRVDVTGLGHEDGSPEFIAALP